MPTPLTFESRITLLCDEDVEELDVAKIYEIALNRLNPVYYDKMIHACQEQDGFNNCMYKVTSSMFNRIHNGKIMQNATPVKIAYAYISCLFNWDTAYKTLGVGIQFSYVQDALYILTNDRFELFKDILNNNSQTAIIAKHLQNRSNYSRQDLSKHYTPEQLYEAYAGYKSREECLELWATSTEKQL